MASNIRTKNQAIEFIGEHYPEVICKKRDQLEKYISFLKEKKNFEFQIVTSNDENYPQNLLLSHKPPAAICMLGRPAWKNSPGISVVGSRKLAPESKTWLRTEFYNFLISRDLYTVSGGALGADFSCHLISLQARCPTVVVLPTGIRKTYPRELIGLKKWIIESGGALVSTFFPDQGVRKNLFPLRNRTIVSMTKKLLLIQAARRSGSYMSARLALDEGRDVGIIPGHPMDSNFLGGLDLLFDGGHFLRHEPDLQLFYDDL